MTQSMSTSSTINVKIPQNVNFFIKGPKNSRQNPVMVSTQWNQEKNPASGHVLTYIPKRDAQTPCISKLNVKGQTVEKTVHSDINADNNLMGLSGFETNLHPCKSLLMYEPFSTNKNLITPAPRSKNFADFRPQKIRKISSFQEKKKSSRCHDPNCQVCNKRIEIYDLTSIAPGGTIDLTNCSSPYESESQEESDDEGENESQEESDDESQEESQEESDDEGENESQEESNESESDKLFIEKEKCHTSASVKKVHYFNRSDKKDFYSLDLNKSTPVQEKTNYDSIVSNDHKQKLSAVQIQEIRATQPKKRKATDFMHFTQAFVDSQSADNKIDQLVEYNRSRFHQSSKCGGQIFNKTHSQAIDALSLPNGQQLPQASLQQEEQTARAFVSNEKAQLQQVPLCHDLSPDFFLQFGPNSSTHSIIDFPLNYGLFSPFQQDSPDMNNNLFSLDDHGIPTQENSFVGEEDSCTSPSMFFKQSLESKCAQNESLIRNEAEECVEHTAQFETSDIEKQPDQKNNVLDSFDQRKHLDLREEQEMNLEVKEQNEEHEVHQNPEFQEDFPILHEERMEDYIKTEKNDGNFIRFCFSKN